MFPFLTEISHVQRHFSWPISACPLGHIISITPLLHHTQHHLIITYLTYSLFGFLWFLTSMLTSWRQKLCLPWMSHLKHSIIIYWANTVQLKGRDKERKRHGLSGSDQVGNHLFWWQRQSGHKRVVLYDEAQMIHVSAPRTSEINLPPPSLCSESKLSKQVHSKVLASCYLDFPPALQNRHYGSERLYEEIHWNLV